MLATQHHQAVITRDPKPLVMFNFANGTHVTTSDADALQDHFDRYKRNASKYR